MTPSWENPNDFLQPESNGGFSETVSWYVYDVETGEYSDTSTAVMVLFNPNIVAINQYTGERDGTIDASITGGAAALTGIKPQDKIVRGGASYRVVRVGTDATGVFVNIELKKM